VLGSFGDDPSAAPPASRWRQDPQAAIGFVPRGGIGFVRRTRPKSGPFGAADLGSFRAGAWVRSGNPAVRLHGRVQRPTLVGRWRTIQTLSGRSDGPSRESGRGVARTTGLPSGRRGVAWRGWPRPGRQGRRRRTRFAAIRGARLSPRDPGRARAIHPRVADRTTGWLGRSPCRPRCPGHPDRTQPDREHLEHAQVTGPAGRPLFTHDSRGAGIRPGRVWPLDNVSVAG
jgi:hypothetical protein